MKRIVLACLAVAAALLFSATVPTAAVAGLRTIAATGSSPQAEQCDATGGLDAGFVVVACKKKQQEDAAPCQPLHAIVPPAAQCLSAASRQALRYRETVRLSAAGHDQPLKPPRA